MSSTLTTADPTPATRALAGKYLVFAVGSEEYGAPVIRVREIIKMLDITKVPQAPAHIRGVINLRGKVIPVTDVRARFALPERPYDEHTCIVVVESAAGGTATLMGLVVDSVSEVLNIAHADIEETPHFGAEIRSEFLHGLAKVKGKVKLLLVLDRVCNSTPRR